MIRSNSKNNKKKYLKADCLKFTSFTLLVFIIEKEEHLFILLSARHMLGSYSFPHLSVKASGTMATVYMK